MAPRLENCPKVLVVEGYSDLLFYAEVLQFLGRLDGVYIRHFEGKHNLVTNLEVFLTPKLLAEKEAIAVIVDADADGRAAAQSLAGALGRISGQAVVPGGWTAGPPRVGLEVVPGVEASGEIESLVWQGWKNTPGNAATAARIEQYVADMSRAGFPARSPDKALVGALLAVRFDEDPRLGPGARSGVFDFSRPEYARLRSFLSGL